MKIFGYSFRVCRGQGWHNYKQDHMKARHHAFHVNHHTEAIYSHLKHGTNLYCIANCMTSLLWNPSRTWKDRHKHLDGKNQRNITLFWQSFAHLKHVHGSTVICIMLSENFLWSKDSPCHIMITTCSHSWSPSVIRNMTSKNMKSASSPANL